MSVDPIDYQAVELLELTRAVDATQRVIHLGVFRLRCGEHRSALLSRRSLCFRALDSDLVPDTVEIRASHDAARAALYARAGDSFHLERIPIPATLPPLPWLPPQDETRSAEIGRLEALLDFQNVADATTVRFAGLARRFLLSIVPGRERQDIACLLERSVRAVDGGDESVQLTHVCRSGAITSALEALRGYAKSIGVAEIARR